MLRFLTIRRLAVIDSAEVEFEAGLNVLTGETGAGKSMLVEAVGLLLGSRASGDLVRTGEDVAVVEAVFEQDGTELVVRREVTAQGRSRAFVNGDMATAAMLKDLAGGLIELHGQHEHQTLLDPSAHLSVLDEFANAGELRAEVRRAFDAMRGADTARREGRQRAADRMARLDLLDYQLSELDRASPVAGEDDELAAQRHVLISAERVERLCTEARGLLYDDDQSALAALGQIWKRVGELASLDSRFQPFLDARPAMKSQLEDLASFLRRYADNIDASPAMLQRIEDRLALLERLKRKHGPTLAEVLARHQALRTERDDLDHADQQAQLLDAAYDQLRQVYAKAAAHLSERRHDAARAFSGALSTLLSDLAMGKSGFDVRFGERLAEPDWTRDGVDRAEFFLSTNTGEDLRPLARIVSGGELSRVMLAIKTLTFKTRIDAGPTSRGSAPPGMIFDEVDAGIGGRVADVVGQKLQALGSAFQVICITHLPQIAARADTHFVIEKRVSDGRTRTTVRRLSPDERVEELARMLGGATVTEAIRTSAREMLADRATGAKGEKESKGESESAAPAKPGRKGVPRPRH